jgi:hypothetical protein
LALSLNAFFHLTEDDVFEQRMRRGFAAASRDGIVCSSNRGEPSEPASAHVRHRQFTRWVGQHIAAEWSPQERIRNKPPYNDDFITNSVADSYVYKKT